MNVTLTEHELSLAVEIGKARHLSALRDGKNNAFGARKKDDWSMHILGATGELVVAKALGIYWSATVDTYKTKSDLPGGLEVRARSRDDYDLIVRANDPDDVPFVLVVGEDLTFRVPGWIWGREAKQEKWLKTYANRTPAYFVPQSALCGLDRLPVTT